MPRDRCTRGGRKSRYSELRPAWGIACTQAPCRLLFCRQSERIVGQRPEITERNGNLDHLGVGGKGLARSFLVPLHGVHKFKLVACILLLEGRGVDSLPSLLANPRFRVRP